MKQTVTINFYGTALDVTGDYIPGRPGCMYLRNGDPGYPPEDAGFFIESIKIGGIECFDMFDALSVEHRRVTAGKPPRYEDAICEIENACIEAIENQEPIEIEEDV